MKLGLATVVVAGSIGAGVAIQHHGAAHHKSNAPKVAASAPGGPSADGVRSTPSPFLLMSTTRAGPRARPLRAGTIDVAEEAATAAHRHEAESRTDDRHGHRGRGDEGSDREHLGVISSAPLLADEDDHQGSSDDSGRSGNSGRGGAGLGGSGSGSHLSGSKHGGHGSDDAPAEVVGTVPAAQSTSGGSNLSGGSGSSGDGSSSGEVESSGGSGSPSGGSGTSDGGSDTDTSSPPTSGSGSSGGPSTSSLGSTTSSTDSSDSGDGSGVFERIRNFSVIFALASG